MKRLDEILQKFPEEATSFPLRQKVRVPYVPSNQQEKIFHSGIVTEKLDGALTNVFIRNNGASGAASHRVSKRTGKPINYTYKIPELIHTTVPSTVRKADEKLDLKGEFVFEDASGKILPHNEISGLLNSKNENALQKISDKGLRPKIALFDIWDDNRSYSDKYKDLKSIADAYPKLFFVPAMAATREEKQKMLDMIVSGKNTRTKEGIIWQGDKGAGKIKLKHTATVFINSFFDTLKENSKYSGNAVGGFYYSLLRGNTPVGKVGTGFTDSVRRDMHSDNDKYIGRKALIEHQGQYAKTGAYRTPVFKYMLD